MPSWLNESRTKNLSFQTPFYQPLQFDSLPDMDPSHMRPKVNLRKYMTKVEDQGYRKSCVAEAVAGSLEYLIKRYRGPRRDGTEFDVSRMFIVWVGNMIEKESQEPPNNEGAWLPEAILGVLKYGFCDERLWPPNEYTLFSQPPKKVFEAAKNHTIIPLVIPPNLDSMKKCLNYELPFLIGFDAALFRKSDMRRINNNYNRTGPARQDSQGHVVLIVGYDDHKQLFLARNSWGSQWGFGGYFYIPYKYLTDKKFMGHDENGIWAIAEILPRNKHLLFRFPNPPKDPNNPFLTLPTIIPSDVKYWIIRRFVILGRQYGYLNTEDMNNTDLLWEKYIDFLQEFYPERYYHMSKRDRIPTNERLSLTYN